MAEKGSRVEKTSGLLQSAVARGARFIRPRINAQFHAGRTSTCSSTLHSGQTPARA